MHVGHNCLAQQISGLDKKQLSVGIYSLVEQEVMAGQCHTPSHPGVIKNINMNRNILHRYLTQEIL